MLTLAVGCVNRPTKPLVLTEQMGEIPVEFTSSNCDIPMLSAPPSQPYEIIARVKTYGNPKTGADTMHNALHQEACAIGAQAVILEGMKEGEFDDTIITWHFGQGSARDYKSRADYAYQLIGMAIRYK